MKQKTALSALAALLVGTTASFANETYLDNEMSIFLSGLELEGNVSFIEYPDVDSDGMAEALVHMKTPLVEGGEIAEWKLIKMVDGSAKQIFSWAGDDVSIVSAESDGATQGADVIISDGSTWGYITEAMRPYNDLVTQRMKFIAPGTADDLALFEELYESHDLDVERPADIGKVRIEAAPGQYITVMSLRGDGYWRETDGASPYLMLDVRGEPFEAGLSFLMPSVYVMDSGDLYVIESVNFGYAGKSIPQGKWK